MYNDKYTFGRCHVQIYKLQHICQLPKLLHLKIFQVEQKHMLIMILIVLNYQIKVSFILS